MQEVPMLDGQWNLYFISNLRNIDGGVIEFCDNKIRGGDSDCRYLGEFDLAEGVLSGELKAVSQDNKPHCLFGFHNQFSMYLYGNVESSQMDLTGYLANNPTIKVKLRCTKINPDLPSD
jgi:hypothetical protein